MQWHILLTTRKGKLIWFECKRKSAPDVIALNQLSLDIDKVSFESDRAVDTALSQIAYTHDIHFLRGNFLDRGQWPLEAWQRDELMHTHFTTTNIQQLTQQRERTYIKAMEEKINFTI